MKPLDLHPSVWALARLLASQGYGHEDIVVKIGRAVISPAQAKAIVLGRKAQRKEAQCVADF